MMNTYIPSLLVPDTALSVAGLTAYIQALLEQDDQLRQVWVTGEVSSATRYRSGLFFTLQDPDAKAAISCVVWNSQIDRLVAQPQQGEQLIILGRIHVHPQRGQYQLIVWQVLPAGEGLRALRYRQLRHRLEAEGLFDPANKRSLPIHPKTVAVVTSPQAAAWGDIQRTLRRRYPGLHVLFSPALVQGDQAPASIVDAIRRVERDGRADVLIVSRGGGAIEDMACFNDERVVRAISTCSIPVIAGIGHQRDESLADLAADVCVHTPTAAAEQAVPRLSDLYTEHRERVLTLNQVMLDRLGASQEHLLRLHTRLQRFQLDRRLKHEQQTMTWLRLRLVQSTLRQVQQAK
ncbi:MAG TPA: exodeoxyribonuclease VII large subunit, partial [Microcoleaceae cyanobacterium]